MSQKAVTLAVTLVGGAILGLALGMLLRPAAPAYQERPETTIVLRSVDGACRPGDPLPLAQKTAQNVTWRIQNECKEPYDVELRNFREKRSDGSLGPAQIVTNPPAPRGTIGAAVGMIPAQVTKSDVPKGGLIYKYEIWLAPRGRPLQLGRDPDMEIWP